MKLLTAVLAFMLSLPVTLILLLITRYIMDTMVSEVSLINKIYYPANVDVFFMVLTFVSIFAIVALGLNAMGVGEDFRLGGKRYD